MSEDKYIIYPAIGVARVGDSEDFYLGPETINGLPVKRDGSDFTRADFRDAAGRVRRQAARFRVYRLRDGAPPEEVTLDTEGVDSIRWTVHLANKKASWYEFHTTRGQTGYAPNHPLRNRKIKAPEHRRRLNIDPGPRDISGRSGSGVRFSRDTIPEGYHGYFPPEGLRPRSIDTLGELQTDAQGRLLVLGGHGRSGSDREPAIADYANNDGWWDDTSDGPVDAVIHLGAKSVKAQPAWLICGPPSYAPQIPNVVTLHDTIFDAAVRHQGARPDIYEDGLWKRGREGFAPCFETDIKPMFERVGLNAWVAAIPLRPHAFDWEKLGHPGEEFIGLRHYYLNFFRPPGSENDLIDPKRGATLMPYLAGDDALGTASTATSKYLRLTDTQYFFLMQWAKGRFRPGRAPEPSPGEALTRAALENCVGGAFSPGIEMSWNSRDPAIYSEPFRIRPRAVGSGPLSPGFDRSAGMEPGDVTRNMAVPWQADFNECSSQPSEGRVLWWWPAQRPEFVYLDVRPEDATRGPGPHLGPQVPWVGTAFDQNADGYLRFIDDLTMVEKWDKLGFIYNVGTDDSPRFVEVGRRLSREEEETKTKDDR